MLNIAIAIKKMTLNEIRDFVCKSYYERIGLPKENNYYSMKQLMKRIYGCLQTK